MESLKQRVEEGKNLVINSNDPEFDRLMKGMLRAWGDVLDVRFEETQDMVTILEEAE